MIGSMGRARKFEYWGMPIFATCNKSQLGQVAALTVPTQLKKGTAMTRQGAAGGLAFIIVTGTAEVVRDGKRLALLGPGDVVGELSLIDGEPRSATVTATSDLEVLELNRADLLKLVTKAPPVMRKLLESLAQRLRDADLLPTDH